ncbi:MAG: 3-deoxy-8-phosphooctulonate synthase [Halanaerobiaceae bacterium]
MATKIRLNDQVVFSQKEPFVLIAGPCALESREIALKTASALKEITDKLKIPFVFKSSYDKANRSSHRSFRGPGLEKGLRILAEIKDELNLPVLSDVHSPEEARIAGDVLDIIQIPAFLCRQTDLVLAVGETGRVVNVKKGQFLAPWDIDQVVEKIESTGNYKILLTERGASFGYNNLVSDFRSLVRMAETGYPVVFDVTHSVQLPGAAGDSSGGEKEYAPALARAATAVGVSSLFIETHPEPAQALSDSATMIPLDKMEGLLKEIKAFDDLKKGL